MAVIRFSSDKARDRYRVCREMTDKRGDTTLLSCLKRLQSWSDLYVIYIGLDFDEMSFTFWETYVDDSGQQRIGISGGIVYHGARDGYGSGNGPTFSATLDKAEGYRIHT